METEQTKHTIGPWRSGSSVMKIGERKFIAVGNGAENVGYASITGCVDENTARANAAVMSASVEMLEVIKQLLAMRSKCFIPNENDWWDKKALAVVAKASGENS